MRNNILQKSQTEIFKKYAQDIEVFLRSTKTKNENYDKFRDVGYTKNILNPIFIKAIKRTLSPSSLIYRELGLVEVGAIELTVKNSDVDFLKLSDKIKFNNEEYYAYNDAVGSKFQVYKSSTGYSRVIVFRKDK